MWYGICTGLCLFAVFCMTDALTECQRRFHGQCKPLFDFCPSGYQETLSYCDFLQSCCYAPSHSGSGTHGTTAPPGHTHASCGNPTIASQHRIVGGTVATHGAYPWQASIRYRSSHICGGTLISNQWVLTAAHCFEDSPHSPHYWTVGLGLQNVHSTSGHVHSASKVIVHHRYNSKQMKNDIALIKLSKPVDISGAYIKPACLPSSHESFDNVVCTATGWGSTHEDGNIVSSLREVDVSVIPNAQCEYFMNKGDVFSSILCAGYARGGKDTCQGDSGGPLVCKRNNIWKVAGVVSWGYGCGDRNSPGIYTRVSSFLSWIHTQQNH